MANRLRGIGQDNTSAHAFVCYNAANEVWNGAAYEAWADANIANYDVAAARLGTTTRYVGDEPAGCTHYELWLWTGVLATSYPVYEGALALPDAPPATVGGLLTAGDGANQILTNGAGSANADVKYINSVAPTQDGDGRIIVAVGGIADGIITSAKFAVSVPAGVAAGILEKVDQLWRRFFKRATFNKTTGELRTFADDGTTALTTQSVVKSGNDEAQGAAA